MTVETEAYRAAIGPGLLVLLAIDRGDGDPAADWMAGKLATLRVFADAHHSMTRCIRPAGAEARPDEDVPTWG